MRLIFLAVFILAFLSLISVAYGVEIAFHVSPVDDTVYVGEKSVLTLIVENEATLSNFVINENTSNLLRMITTAKSLRIEIDDSNTPFTVESSNPYIIGDLPSGVVAKATFRINVSKNAKTGVYSIPIKLRYVRTTYYLSNGNAVISDEDETYVRYIKITVKKKDYDVSLKVLKSNLTAGKEGIIELQVENTGSKTMKNCIAFINASPPFKPNPVTMMAFLGDLESGERKNATFKMFVMDGALNRAYPVSVILKFENENGIPMAMSKTVGLDVDVSNSFVLIKADSFIPGYKKIPTNFGIQGVRGYVIVSIKNLGENIDDVNAFLSFETPLIHSENFPYLGKFKKGKEKNLIFYVISSAPAGEYRGEVTLKYRNEFGDDEVSKSLPVKIEVRDNSSIEISDVNPANLGIGVTQSIEIRVQNTLDKSLKGIKLTLLSSDKSFIPLSSTSYIDVLKAGEAKSVTFRLSISDQASEGMHLLYLIEEYSIDDINNLVSVEEFPIMVKSSREEFKIVSVSSDLVPDETGDVTVVFRNSGNRTIKDAVLELDLSPPLYPAGSSSLLGITGKPQPSLYYIGTLRAGDEAKAVFRVDVDKDAGAGIYPATVRVRYYDAGGYMHISNPITISIEVGEKEILTPVTITAVIMVSMALLISAIFMRRRKKRES